MTSPPDDTDLHAVITALRAERDAALAQKAALAEVLEVINQSPGDPKPVFEAILERAMRLCGATFGEFWHHNGEFGEIVALRGLPAAYAAARRGERFRLSTPGSFGAAGVAGERIFHVADLKDTTAYRAGMSGRRAIVDIGGARTALGIPFFKDDEFVGGIVIYRQEVRLFSDEQVVLLRGFADQAVIAMENARLVNEQREALEQQTATAEVLQVINAKPGDLAPVFDVMLEKALRLCQAEIGVLWTYDGELMHPTAIRSPSLKYAEFLQKGGPRRPAEPQRPLLRGEPFIQVADLSATQAYRDGDPLACAFVDVGGFRSLLNVALRKENRFLGLFAIYRTEVLPFSDKEIALLENFAAQAVIAMENARLINEQREALEQQTATAEVLQVINAYPGNLTQVFDAILDKAHILCGAVIGSLVLFDGTYFRAVATHGWPASITALIREPTGPNRARQSLVDGERFVQVADLRAIGHENRAWRDALVESTDARTMLLVPLRKDGALLGFISAFRLEVRLFSGKEIALLENFAAQAVIAIENARLLTEQQEALEQQTATAEILQVINASPGNLAPVFDAMLEKATRLCEAAFGVLWTHEGEVFRAAALRGVPPAYSEFVTSQARGSSPGGVLGRLARGEPLVHIPDAASPPPQDAIVRTLVELGNIRTLLAVPLRKDDALLGAFTIYREEVRPFSDKQIALVENFAAQAVIAMENARLINEQREALEQQTATAEVLQVINANPGNLAPVFDAILEKAHNLCDVAVGSLSIYLNGFVHTAATRGFSEEYQALLRHPYPAIGSHQTLMLGGPSRQTSDFRTVPVRPEMASSLDHFERMNLRTGLWVPLRKDGTALGCISSYRDKVQPFSEKEIALLENFAAQGVIAMENARLLDEIRQRQEELRVTFENMGDGVAMFDETQHLVAWNRKFQEVLDVPDDIIARRQTFSEYVHYLAERGEYDPETDPDEHVRRLIEQAGQSRTYERIRPDGRMIEVRHNPVAGGGFVLIISDITERKRNELEIRAARDAAEEASRTIEAAYRDLKTAQANLIQAEKMASLGQLTAGIAHEIKNPLNFVNNFAALSVDLLDELKDAIAPADHALTERQRAEVEDVSAMLTSNLEKITEHGKRADGIVKAMLEHSRGSSAERRMVDLNAVIDEALNLAYHGARAQDQSFNITLERDFGESISPIEVNPQDMTRVFLNIFSNGFYATTKRARSSADAGFVPTLKVTTRDTGDAVEIRVRDNGIGIPGDLRDKIFEPFVTTKPAGQGTGLGLSITYDIVTQQHGGTIAADSNVGEYSEFAIRLPRRP